MNSYKQFPSALPKGQKQLLNHYKTFALIKVNVHLLFVFYGGLAHLTLVFLLQVKANRSGNSMHVLIVLLLTKTTIYSKLRQ